MNIFRRMQESAKNNMSHIMTNRRARDAASRQAVEKEREIGLRGPTRLRSRFRSHPQWYGGSGKQDKKHKSTKRYKEHK